jgi:hypothetical protein
MKLLIDGDVLAHRAGFATEKTKYLAVRGAVFVEYGSADEAKKGSLNQIGDAVITRLSGPARKRSPRLKP